MAIISPEKRIISLREYNGLGSDYIQLNQPVANRFMTLANMRSDVSIVKQTSPDQKPELYNRQWVIPIDDEDAMQKAVQEENVNQHRQFAREFSKKLREQLDTCLGNEKILNAGGDHKSLIFSYIGLGLIDLFLPLYIATGITPDANRLNAVLATMIIVGVTNFGINYVNELSTMFTNPNEPFTRHSLAGKLLPPVPLEQFVLGQTYLTLRGTKLVTIKK